MPGLAYTLNVNTPCPGEQLVTKRATDFYTGMNGDFTYALLNKDSTINEWGIVIYDNTGTACTPNKIFKQVPPDPNNPNGTYHAVGPNGPDPSEGVLTVSPFP
jgi:hypothetical protein